MNKFLSRKFIVAVATGIAGVLVALYPDRGHYIHETTQTIAGLVTTVLAALGYLAAEAKVDAARKDK